MMLKCEVCERVYPEKRNSDHRKHDLCSAYCKQLFSARKLRFAVYCNGKKLVTKFTKRTAESFIRMHNRFHPDFKETYRFEYVIKREYIE